MSVFSARLLDEQSRVRDEKRKLRKVLREFEDEFQALNGRKVQKDDRAPMSIEYQEYKVRTRRVPGVQGTYAAVSLVP